MQRHCIIGLEPRSPPKSTVSPTVFPFAGMMRTAVVLLLTMPIAASSAMIAEMVSALVSPGTAIMSSPTEQTQVIASSLSMQSIPSSTAEIMPASSDTGINAPDRPPTWLEAMTPPFLTASLRSARAAVVPCVPHFQAPLSPVSQQRCRRSREWEQGRGRPAEKGHTRDGARPPAQQARPCALS